MGMSEFIIRQIMHKDIWYFSYKMRKSQFLSQAMKYKRKGCTAKLLNKHKQASPQTEYALIFCRREKILLGSESEFTECSVTTKCINSEENQTPSSHHSIWFGLVLWHNNHCRLFNAKSILYIYIKYMICRKHF